MDGPIFNRLQLGTAFSRQLPPYFPRLSHTYIHITCTTSTYTYIHVITYMKAVGNKGVDLLRRKISFWTFSQAGRAPTVLFTERKF